MTDPASIGVVLAGGRATRMGGDKAGALLDGRTLLERAVTIVRAAGLEPRVCARASTALPEVPGLEPAAIWREPADPAGGDDAHPLAGLAHAVATAGEPIVAFPIDLPLLPAVVLRRLATHSGPAAVLGVAGRPAALVVRVTPPLAAALAEAASHHAPALRTLRALGAEVIDLTDAAPGIHLEAALFNVNTPADLAAPPQLHRPA